MSGQNVLATPKNVARETLRLVLNNSVLLHNVHRGYEEELKKQPNGYGLNGEVSISRPADFAVREGATMKVQPILEGQVSLKLDTQLGVDFKLSSFEQQHSLKSVSDRVLKRAAAKLVSKLESKVFSDVYRGIPSWVGTASSGARISSFGDFVKGTERLDEMAIPDSKRKAFLSPSDNAGMTVAASTLYVESSAKDAYKKRKLGDIANVETFMTQNVPNHKVGNHQIDNSGSPSAPLIKGTIAPVEYSAVMNTMIQPITTDGWKVDSAAVLRDGDIIEVAGVYAVNPDSGEQLPFRRQFAVVGDVNSDGSGNATIIVTPPLIVEDPYKTVSNAPADNAAISVMGSSNAVIRQNLMIDPSAIALAIVPMEEPEGAVRSYSASHLGVSVRIIPTYDSTNDKSAWRMDLLCGWKLINPGFAVRITGSVAAP